MEEPEAGGGNTEDATLAPTYPPRSAPQLEQTLAGAPPELDATRAAGLLLRTRASSRVLASDEPLALPGEGERVGRFLVARELGRGAMGVVYAAFDEELARRVALKLLHFGPQVDASAGRGQLLREAQALARLTHPNVVAVYEAGVWQRSVYIAMEYVQGVDLAVWLAAKPRPWREVLGVLRQAGEGLLAAHRSGLVHRDFKPSNVLVGDDGRARVVDFGLAASRGDAPVADILQSTPTLLTSTIAGAGSLVGTPAYMAPEQIARADTTALADQFAFCVTLYEALYGERPFAGHDFAALAAAIGHADPPPPPPGSAAPPWIFPLLQRGMARDPARRFPSLAELLAELARDPEADRARRRRLALLLLATAALTLVTIIGGIRLYGALVRRAAEQRAEQRLEFLRVQLGEPAVRDDPAEAARLLAAFAAYPDNRGTAAVPRAYRERAAELVDPAAAIDAFAGAYLTATDQADEIAALRGLIPRLVAAGRHLAAGEAIATLDRRAPELADDPALRLARRAAALRTRDLPAARAALAGLPADDPTRTYLPVLENMSRGTEFLADHFGQRDPARRSFGAADLDGDGRPELTAVAPALGDDVHRLYRADADLTPFARLDLDHRLPIYLLPHDLAGAALMIAEDRADANLRRTVRLLELTPADQLVERLRWTDSNVTPPAVADLDGDGQREVYLGSGAYTRALSRLDRGPDGAWRRSAAAPDIDRIGSDIDAVVAGDLDGDGRGELVVALGPWRAFDLRVLRAPAGGPLGAPLELVARKTVGHATALALVRVGAELWIASTKRDDYGSAARFTARAPYGPPAGLYLHALRGDRLVEVGFFPLPGDPEIDHFSAPLLVADLDGDGLDDLVFTALDASAERPALVVSRQHAGRLLDPLIIGGLEPKLALQLDDDPALELLVDARDPGPGPFWLLGRGAAPLPALRPPGEPPRPIPALTDPTLAAAWRHAEDLVAIGLPQRSAAELAQLASVAGPVREDMLFRSGELHAAAGAHAAAATSFIAAAERPALAADALAGAIRSRQALGELAAEVELAARRAALPGLAADERVAAEAELATLRRATAPGTRVDLRFDGPLDPRWQITDPLALAREPDGLRLQSSHAGLVAGLPVRHTGGAVTLDVEFAVDFVAWGGEVQVLLVGDQGVATLRVAGQGGVDAPECLLFNRARMFERLLPQPPVGRVRLRQTVYPELGLMTAELTLPGQPPQRASARIAPDLTGDLRLELSGRALQTAHPTRMHILAITLEGLELREPTPLAPQQTIARAIVEGELVAALTALPATPDLPPGDLRLLWRADLLARLGDLEAAAVAVRRALPGDPAAVLEDSPALRALALRLSAGDPALQAAAHRVLGARTIGLMHDVDTLGHPWRPEHVGRALAELAALPRAPDPKASPDALVDHLFAVLVRGEAWHRFGRLDLAGPDLEAAAAIAARPGLALPGSLVLYLPQRRLELAIDLGARTQALELARQMLVDAVSPQILLERLRGRDDLIALFTDADWRGLATLAAR